MQTRTLKSSKCFKKLFYVFQNPKYIFYSVMQTDGNSFCSDVVLECDNMASRDEDNTFDQIYEKQKYSDF